MNNKKCKFFLFGFFSIFFFFSFFQISQAGFFDWFGWFKKTEPKKSIEIIPLIIKDGGYSQKSYSSSERKSVSIKSNNSVSSYYSSKSSRISSKTYDAGSSSPLKSEEASLNSDYKPNQSTPPVFWGYGNAPYSGLNSVDAIVLRGGHKEITVSLNAVQELGDIEINIDPKIDSYVDVSPSTLSHIKAGNMIPIRINININQKAPSGLFNGSIQVLKQGRQGEKGEILGRSLPVNLLIQEDKDGISAVDKDSNGIWDYIDQYIDGKYADADNDRLRSASRQYARAIQGGLLNADNKDMSLQYLAAGNRSIECMFYLRPQDADEVLSDLEAAILNTQTRSNAFLMFSEQGAGQVFPSASFSQMKNSCIDNNKGE